MQDLLASVANLQATGACTSIACSEAVSGHFRPFASGCFALVRFPAGEWRGGPRRCADER